MLPTSRVNRSRGPTAERLNFSAAFEPLKSIVSFPSCPSMTSLPSPGSQRKVSSPAPRNAESVPPFPSTKSLPSPPISRSGPAPPSNVSLPAPPLSVVGLLSVNVPFASSIATTSSPPPASTTMLSNRWSWNWKSADPSFPTSTCNAPSRCPAFLGACESSRRTIWFESSLPTIVRVRCSTFAVTPPADFDGAAFAAAASASTPSNATPAVAARMPRPRCVLMIFLLWDWCSKQESSVRRTGVRTVGTPLCSVRSG